MKRVGGEYLQTTLDATQGPEQRRKSRVDFLYGVGNADSVFLSWEGDRLYELPMVWLYTENRWAVSHFFPYRGGSYGRELNPRCLECHNTWINHVPGSLNEYQRDRMILGVTCERCHGPGREHVEHHRQHPGEARGAFVVHPGQLPRERNIEVCTQCHSNAIKHRGPAFNYRPGEPLDEAYKTLATDFPEYDHVANQIQYLRQSKCFQQSESMTCVTCHDPHQQPRPAGSTSSEHSCLQCHQPPDCREQPRLPEPVRADCVGCHLPPIIKINVNFQTPDDDYVPPLRRSEHRIAIHPIARDTVVWEYLRQQPDEDSRSQADALAQSLVQQHLALALEHRTNHRYLAAIAACREALRITRTPATEEALQSAVAMQAQLDDDWNEALQAIAQQRFDDATTLLDQVIARKPDLARAHQKLGTVLAARGKSSRAREHLETAARLDPDDPGAEAMQGWLAFLQDRPAEALPHYQRAMQIEPYDADVTYPYGLVLARLGQLDEAVATFRRLLQIDPRHIRGTVALSDALRRQGKFAEAVDFAFRAAALSDGKDPQLLLQLAICYVEAGQPGHAAGAANAALTAAGQINPQARIELRETLEERGIPYTRPTRPAR